MKDCFIVFSTSRGRRKKERQRCMERCIKLFNKNVRPSHPDVPVLVLSEGTDDLADDSRDHIADTLSTPFEFRTVSLKPPEGLELPATDKWRDFKDHGMARRGIDWFFIRGLLGLLEEFDFFCHFHDDSYFLSPVERNFFDRLREEECQYAYRGTYPERHDYRKRLEELLEYDGNANRGVDGMPPQQHIDNTIFSNFKVFSRSLLASELFTKYTDKPEVQRAIWTDRWDNGVTHTALLSHAEVGVVRHWHDFKYGHAPYWTGRYHMALDHTCTFWQPERWPANKDGEITDMKLYRSRRKGARAEARAKKVVVLDPSQRNKAIVAIGDGLGNIVAQTPLVSAVTEIFNEVHVWLPRSRPDLPEMLRDMPNIVSVNTEWIDAFNDPDAIFQTWLVAPQANGMKPSSLKARYAAQHPRGAKRDESDVCLDAVRKAGWKGRPPAPYVGHDPWLDNSFDNLEGPLFGFTTGRLHRPMWRFKAYPAVQYADVIDILLKRFPHANFVQIGWKKDEEIPHNKIIDTRTKGTLRQSLGLLTQCSVFCGNDTGLCWAANALGVRTVVVFGPTDQVKCTPPWGAVRVSAGLDCQPCQWRGMGKKLDKKECEQECMTQLNPKLVAEMIVNEYRRTRDHKRKPTPLPSESVLADREIPTPPPLEEPDAEVE